MKDQKNNSRTNYIPVEVGKILPQATDIEEALLGAILIEKDSIDKINLKPSFFYKEVHQKIFECILDLQGKSKPIDSLTLVEQLKVKNYLEEIGGPYYISQLTGKVASAAHIENYAAIIQEKFTKRELIRYSQQIMNIAFDDSTDLDDVFDYANDELDKINNESFGEDDIIPLAHSLKKSLKELEERAILFKKGQTIGIKTPIAKLTKWTNGWLKKKLIVIASRPSMGKTALALSILKTAAKDGYNPVLFSLEMDSIEITDRIVIGHIGVNADHYRMGNMEGHEWEQLEKRIKELIDLKILIDDKPKSISRIKSRAKMLKRQGKCDLIIIDYLQLMPTEKGSNREREVADISRSCKLLAMDLEIPVILLSQLNRALESRPNKRPQLSDLRESGAIEQDADIVGFLYRPEYYDLHTDNEGKELPAGYAELDIKKQRGGRTGPVEFRFNESLTEVYDLDSYPNQESNPDQFLEPNKEFDQPF